MFHSIAGKATDVTTRTSTTDPTTIHISTQIKDTTLYTATYDPDSLDHIRNFFLYHNALPPEYAPLISV